MKRLAIIILLILAGGVALAAAWRWSYGEALAKLEADGQGRLSLASDRLVSQLERYRQLPVVLTGDVDWATAFSTSSSLPDLNRQLERLADVTGAGDILLIDATGRTLAAANWRNPDSYIGSNFLNRPDFVRAMHGALGFYHSREGKADARGFYFTSAIRDSAGGTIGALSVKVDLETLEADWRGDQEIIFFTDKNGVVFIANRDSLLLHGLSSVGVTDAAVLRRYSVDGVAPLPARREIVRSGRDVWLTPSSDDIPAEALYLQLPLPVIGMRGNILLDLAPVNREARLRTALVAAFMGLAGLISLVFWQRRRALGERLQVEENANARLEERVRERTATLKQTQRELVQAGKLSALGQMSAGIGHELNQPLAAIQSYADNANVLLDRGRDSEARQNLSRISGLAERMARIITNLRAFARKEGEEAGQVNLVKVVDDALELAVMQLRDSNVKVHWTPPTENVLVTGGRVRLQQVVLNLLSNATDAMEGMQAKNIWIALVETPGRTFLEVRDSGPGLSDPDKIFEPFYSTKPVGAGTGLGLSISYGIVQSFGGRISGANRSGGGAVFRVELSTLAEGAQ